MSARIHGLLRGLLVLSLASTMTGCTAGGGRKALRGPPNCPMNFVMTCEARRPGAETTYGNCRCVRHADF